MRRPLTPNKPDDMPMYIANIVRIKLNKEGRQVVKIMDSKTKKLNIEWIFWGNGLPLYRFDLRFENGKRYDTLYIRAKSPANAITRIKNKYQNVKGVKD